MLKKPELQLEKLEWVWIAAEQIGAVGERRFRISALSDDWRIKPLVRKPPLR
jgi:hypothetical protein